MRPTVILLGIVLGTAGAILFSLVGVAVIILVLGSEYPRLQAEANSLLVNLGFFAALTLFAALSFYGALKERPWRGIAVAPMVLTLGLIVWHYWPE
jgi:hypothetical protein